MVCREGNWKLLEGKTGNPCIQIVINPNAASGMAGSIQCGLERCHDQSQAILIAHADMPLVRSDLMNHLIARSAHHSGMIIAPRYQGRQGNPVVIPRMFWNEIRELRGDVGCKSILERHPDQLHWFDAESDEILFDIDTEDDYREFLRRT